MRARGGHGGRGDCQRGRDPQREPRRPSAPGPAGRRVTAANR